MAASACVLFAFVVGCGPTGGAARHPGWTSDATLEANLKGAARSISVRQAIGDPDAEYVCQQFDSSDWPEDSVEHIRGMGGELPDTKFKRPPDSRFLYVAGRGGERLILLGAGSTYGYSPTTCVRADTGVFVRIEGEWMLREGENEISSPQGWALVRRLQNEEGAVSVADAVGMKNAKFACLTGKSPSDVVDWMQVVEEADIPATRLDPPKLRDFELGLYVVGPGEERFITVPVGEGLTTTARQHCVEGVGAKFERRGAEWVLTGRRVGKA